MYLNSFFSLKWHLHSVIDHQFYHKWALLTDPDDFISGPKGYLKCDIGIIGKGDTMKMQTKSEKDHDDIEAYVLLLKLIFCAVCLIYSFFFVCIIRFVNC